jgi:hypothetical protein
LKRVHRRESDKEKILVKFFTDFVRTNEQTWEIQKIIRTVFRKRERANIKILEDEYGKDIVKSSS